MMLHADEAWAEEEILPVLLPGASAVGFEFQSADCGARLLVNLPENVAVRLNWWEPRLFWRHRNVSRNETYFARLSKRAW